MSSRAKRNCFDPADTQETTIEKLCDDVLVEIFSYLNAEDLKSASLVCKHWNGVIGSSAGIMKKFKLKLKESELISQQFRSSRNHQNIELEMLATNPPSDQKALENLDQFIELSQVKYFKIYAHNPVAGSENAFAVCFDNPWNIFSIDAMKLTSALKPMKQLQELFIECTAGFRGSFTSTIDLPKLTKLAVKSPNWSIFQWLSARNVTEFDLSHKPFFIVSVQHLASFLKLCKQITTLRLDSGIAEDLFGDDKWKDFNLKLSGLDIEINAYRDATSFREFLISQAPSLTSLRMKNVFMFVPKSEAVSVIEAVGHLKNLKILSLDYVFVDGNFLRHLPELEQLTLYKVNDINSIARFNRKLTYLKLEFVKNPLDTALQFSELKHLCIGYDCWSHYLKVIRGCPKVQTFDLRLPLGYFADAYRYDQRCDEIIKVVLQQPTLRHLKLEFWGIGLNIEHLRKAFDIIASDYGNLKSLGVRAEVGQAWRSVEFSFPENRSEFKADEQKRRLEEIFADK